MNNFIPPQIYKLLLILKIIVHLNNPLINVRMLFKNLTYSKPY